jgi:hypothetical protein
MKTSLRENFAIGVFLRVVLCKMSIKLLYSKYKLVTQKTHSSLVDYQRRTKYFILPPDFETSKNISTIAEPKAGRDGSLWDE